MSIEDWLVDLRSHSYVIDLGEPDATGLITDVEALLRRSFEGETMVVPYETRLGRPGLHNGAPERRTLDVCVMRPHPGVTVRGRPVSSRVVRSGVRACRATVRSDAARGSPRSVPPGRPRCGVNGVLEPPSLGGKSDHSEPYRRPNRGRRKRYPCPSRCPSRSLIDCFVIPIRSASRLGRTPSRPG